MAKKISASFKKGTTLIDHCNYVHFVKSLRQEIKFYPENILLIKQEVYTDKNNNDMESLTIKVTYKI